VAVGDQWQQAARLFQEAAAPGRAPVRLSEVAHVMNRIAGQEETAWQRLQALV